MDKQPPTRLNIIKWVQQHLELMMWVVIFGMLFFMDTSPAQPSLCIFRFVGFDYCPGCGIGHSIHDALHLNFKQSFNEHPLGVPAVLIILFRIKQLSFSNKTTVYEV